jgi:tRNA A-37 threonylcarbamoyl transferase component Bud32
MSAETIYRLDNGKEIACLGVVRSLPGKRLVFLGEYEGNRVFAKLYLDAKRAEKHWQRELDGLAVFNKCGIPTADLIYAGKTESGEHPVILLTQLVGLKSVKQMWEESDDLARVEIIRRMTMLLTRHHHAGLCQTDLHLDNFMCSDDEIFSLDGAGVKFYPNGVEKKASLENLALFLAQFTPEWESQISDVHNLYANERGWLPDTDHMLLHEKVRDAREGRWKEFRNKLFRNCTAFTYTKHSAGYQVVANKYQSGELLELLQNPDASFPGKEQALKNGNTCTVWPTAVGGLDLVVKRYNVKNIWHGIKLRLLSGRAERSWVNGHRLLFYGVPTPAPVALMEQRRGLFPTAYLLTEQVQAVSAREWFRDQNISMEDKNGMAEQIAKILHAMRQQSIVHGDLKATNILIAEEKPLIIDLDAMRRIPSDSEFRSAWATDIERFLKNWDDNGELLGMFRKVLKSRGIDDISAV